MSFSRSGTLCLLSHFETAWRDTPICSASSSCFIFCSFLHSCSLYPNSTWLKRLDDVLGDSLNGEFLYQDPFIRILFLILIQQDHGVGIRFFARLTLLTVPAVNAKEMRPVNGMFPAS